MKRLWKKHEKSIINCEKCPRLRKYCQKIAVEKRKSYQDEKYWGKPVPFFGDTNAEIIIIGLAPAAHGANRTGRMFTGDRSGEWLYRALFKAGLATKKESLHLDDRLELKNCFITASAHCAPPDNKPTPKELKNCSSFLDFEIANLRNAKVFIGLGKIGFDSVFEILKKHYGENIKKRPKFSHGCEFRFSNGVVLLGSYHPSQQNTFTGKLTEPMFDGIFTQALKMAQSIQRI